MFPFSTTALVATTQFLHQIFAQMQPIYQVRLVSDASMSLLVDHMLRTLAHIPWLVSDAFDETPTAADELTVFAAERIFKDDRRGQQLYQDGGQFVRYPRSAGTARLVLITCEHLLPNRTGKWQFFSLERLAGLAIVIGRNGDLAIGTWFDHFDGAESPDEMRADRFLHTTTYTRQLLGGTARTLPPHFDGMTFSVYPSLPETFLTRSPGSGPALWSCDWQTSFARLVADQLRANLFVYDHMSYGAYERDDRESRDALLTLRTAGTARWFQRIEPQRQYAGWARWGRG